MDPVDATVVVGYFAIGLVPLALVPYVRRHRRTPGSLGLLVTIVGASLWTIALGPDYVLRSYPLARVAGVALLLGILLAVVGYFLVAVEYTGLAEPTRRTMGLVALPAGAFLAISLTDPLHGIAASRGLVTIADAQFEAYTVAIHAYAIALTIVGVLLFAAEVVTTQGVRQRQSLAMAGAAVPPLALATPEVFHLVEVPYSVIPVGFVCSTFVFAWALFRADFLAVAPIARKRVVEEMSDAAVTVDSEGRVVDANATARDLLEVGPEYVGMPAADFFGAYPDLVERFWGEDDVDTEISVVDGGTERFFHLNISRVESGSAGGDGRLIVLRDVTALKRRERELDLVRQVLTRVLRHNLRNDITVIRGYAEMIEDEADPEHAAMARQIVSKSDDLVALGRKARTVEGLVDLEPTASEVDLRERVEGLVAIYREAYPDVPISVAGPEACVVEVDPSIEFALENLLENAVVHGASGAISAARQDGGRRPAGEPGAVGGRDGGGSSGGDRNGDPRDDPPGKGAGTPVEVSIEPTDERVTITVADDGPGIPESELAVLEQGEETPLEHGSGIGLWIVHWIVDRTGTTLSIETGDDGTSVSLRIPR